MILTKKWLAIESSTKGKAVGVFFGISALTRSSHDLEYHKLLVLFSR